MWIWSSRPQSVFVGYCKWYLKQGNWTRSQRKKGARIAGDSCLRSQLEEGGSGGILLRFRLEWAAEWERNGNDHQVKEGSRAESWCARNKQNSELSKGDRSVCPLKLEGKHGYHGILEPTWEKHAKGKSQLSVFCAAMLNIWIKKSEYWFFFPKE